ncbi:MAG: hypothetical protein ABI626_05400 [Sphingomicrobium sp.]
MPRKLNIFATAVTVAFAASIPAESAATQTAPTTDAQVTTTTTQSSTTQTQAPAEPTPGTAEMAVPATTQTTTTTTTEQTTTAPAEAGAVALATVADIKAGASVYDESGALVGKVDSATADGAVVNTGKVRAQIQLSAFAKNDKGLVISATKAELDAQAKAAKPKT